MVKFDVKRKKPGDVIRSEDWNTMQEDIKADLEELVLEIQKLREYVDNMQETATLLNISSTVGKAYPLNEVVEGETASYETEIVGLLTKQWLLVRDKTGEICRFGVVTLLDSLDYWSGAENGDKKALEVVFDYMDGTSEVVSDLFVHDRSKLRPQGEDNPYLDYLLSPNEYVWYRYRVRNPNPNKEVLTVSFRNTNLGCTPRIGNVMHYRAKITPAEIPTETPTE